MQRLSAIAGTFYPDNNQDLRITIEDLLNQTEKKFIKNIKSVIVPHAGLIYSGNIAASAYKQWQNIENKEWRIFLIGPVHYMPIYASIGNYSTYEIPSGPIAVDQKTCKELLKNPKLQFIPEAHSQEHCLEIQLPFLYNIFKKFSIIPILCGSISPEQLATILNPYFTHQDTLFIFSSDLSHFFPYQYANEIDQATIQQILAKNTDAELEACGSVPIKTAIYLAKLYHYKITLLDHQNSGDTSGNLDKVVGYASFAIHK